MNTKDLTQLGVLVGEPTQLAHEFIQSFIRRVMTARSLRPRFSILSHKSAGVLRRRLGAPLARAIYRLVFMLRGRLAPWRAQDSFSSALNATDAIHMGISRKTALLRRTRGINTMNQGNVTFQAVTLREGEE